MMANHGQSKKYIHDVVGVNSRLDTIQAGILNVKLKYLDEFTASRRNVADYYDQAFLTHSEIKTPFRISSSTHVFHQYTIQLENEKTRDDLQEYLKKQEYSFSRLLSDSCLSAKTLFQRCLSSRIQKYSLQNSFVTYPFIQK
jgi:dTDP-4-amino-4,6-dideoxygalactose transaminase